MISPIRTSFLLLPVLIALGSLPVLAQENPQPVPAAAAPAVKAAAPTADLAPDKVVSSYLKAMQEQRFTDAYQYVSTTLRAGKSVEEWAKEQQYVMQMGEVKILEYKTFPGIIGKDGTARVPNILKSQDKFLNQLGLDEHEIYELIKEGGAWRIDQQTLAEGADRAEYFPDEGGKK